MWCTFAKRTLLHHSYTQKSIFPNIATMSRSWKYQFGAQFEEIYNYNEYFLCSLQKTHSPISPNVFISTLRLLILNHWRRFIVFVAKVRVIDCNQFANVFRKLEHKTMRNRGMLIRTDMKFAKNFRYFVLHMPYQELFRRVFFLQN